ncbi:MAG: ComF family protein [Parvibaculum sp.]|nr:ComF family protein [Parvibaculum sp.]
MLIAALTNLTATFRVLAAKAGDLALPPQCFSCGGSIAQTGALCSTCWSALDFIEAPLCAVSGLPLGSDFSDIDDAPLIRPEVAANPPPYAKARAVMRYTEASAPLILRFKYADHLEAAPAFAQWMTRAGADVLKGADFIMPVPLHRWRLMARRYNQSAELGRHIAKLSGVPFAGHWLARVRATRPQVGLSGDARRRNVAGAFRVSRRAGPALKGKTVVLIDDVMTTGATIEACTHALKAAGARELRVLTLARVVQGDRVSI